MQELAKVLAKILVLKAIFSRTCSTSLIQIQCRDLEPQGSFEFVYSTAI